MNTNTPSTTLRRIVDELHIVAIEMDFICHGIATIDSDEVDGAVFLLRHLQEKIEKLAKEAADANPLPTAGGSAHV